MLEGHGVSLQVLPCSQVGVGVLPTLVYANCLIARRPGGRTTPGRAPGEHDCRLAPGLELMPPTQSRICTGAPGPPASVPAAAVLTLASSKPGNTWCHSWLRQLLSGSWIPARGGGFRHLQLWKSNLEGPLYEQPPPPGPSLICFIN